LLLFFSPGSGCTLSLNRTERRVLCCLQGFLTLSVADPFIELGSAGLGWYCMIGWRPSAPKPTAHEPRKAVTWSVGSDWYAESHKKQGTEGGL
jgi:hypothetical protein